MAKLEKAVFDTGPILHLHESLEARKVATAFGLEAHGTLGLLLRAFREGELNHQEALQATDTLFRTSSLFVTSDLLLWIKREIEQFRR